MKATGIVRHIDELGRIVIPKEIRKNLRIREGDPLEIFTDSGGEIVLKKYSAMGEMTTFAKQFAEVLAQNSGHKVAISDRDNIVAIAGGFPREYLGKKVSKQLETLMRERGSINTLKKGKPIAILEGEVPVSEHQMIYPILGDGDILGSVIILQKDTVGILSEVEQKLVMVAANFLGRQIEA